LADSFIKPWFTATLPCSLEEIKSNNPYDSNPDEYRTNNMAFLEAILFWKMPALSCGFG
jgi:hypothetical protein